MKKKLLKELLDIATSQNESLIKRLFDLTHLEIFLSERTSLSDKLMKFLDVLGYNTDSFMFQVISSKHHVYDITIKIVKRAKDDKRKVTED